MKILPLSCFQLKTANMTLHLTNYYTIMNTDYIKENKIKCVISMIGQTNIIPYVSEYHIYSVRDSIDENIMQYFEETYQIIDRCINADINVLVHCRAGISRSGAIFVNYIMRSRHMRLSTALAISREIYPQIRPNDGFLDQLKNEEMRLGVRPVLNSFIVLGGE